MMKQAENSVLIGDAQTIDLADRKKGELPRLITRYPVRLPDGQEAAFEVNGIGERYIGPPACIPYNGELTEFSDFDEGRALSPVDDIEGAVVCSRLTDADAIHRAGIHKVYILAGDPALAIADGYEALTSEPCLTLLDVPDAKRNGVMRTEDAVRARLRRAVKTKLPGADYRAGHGAAGMSLDDILTAARTAEAPRASSLVKLSTAKKHRRDDVEKLPLRWPKTNTLLGGGLPRGQMTLLTSEEGTGKSTMIEQCIADAVQTPGSAHRLLLFSGEKTLDELTEELTRMIAGPRYIQTYTTASGGIGYDLLDDAYYDIRDRCIGDISYYYQPDEGTPWQVVQTELEEAVAQQGIDIILVDNLMTVCDRVQGRDLYEKQGMVARYLASLALQHNIWVILIAHKRKAQGWSKESSSDDVSGAKDIANASGIILSYERFIDKDGDEEEVGRMRKLKVLKNRTNGKLSTKTTTDYLTYDEASLRTYAIGGSPDWVTRWVRTYDGPEAPRSARKTTEPVVPRITLLYNDNSIFFPAAGDAKEITNTVLGVFGSYINTVKDGKAKVYMQYTGKRKAIDQEPVFIAGGLSAEGLKKMAEDWGIEYRALGC